MRPRPSASAGSGTPASPTPATPRATRSPTATTGTGAGHRSPTRPSWAAAPRATTTPCAPACCPRSRAPAATPTPSATTPTAGSRAARSPAPARRCYDRTGCSRPEHGRWASAPLRIPHYDHRGKVVREIGSSTDMAYTGLGHLKRMFHSRASCPGHPRDGAQRSRPRAPRQHPGAGGVGRHAGGRGLPGHHRHNASPAPAGGSRARPPSGRPSPRPGRRDAAGHMDGARVQTQLRPSDRRPAQRVPQERSLGAGGHGRQHHLHHVRPHLRRDHGVAQLLLGRRHAAGPPGQPCDARRAPDHPPPRHPRRRLRGLLVRRARAPRAQAQHPGGRRGLQRRATSLCHDVDRAVRLGRQPDPRRGAGHGCLECRGGRAGRPADRQDRLRAPGRGGCAGGHW